MQKRTEFETRPFHSWPKTNEIHNSDLSYVLEHSSIENKIKSTKIDLSLENLSFCAPEQIHLLF